MIEDLVGIGDSLIPRYDNDVFGVLYSSSFASGVTLHVYVGV